MGGVKNKSQHNGEAVDNSPQDIEAVQLTVASSTPKANRVALNGKQIVFSKILDGALQLT
jgi:hypothetical protein